MKISKLIYILESCSWKPTASLERERWLGTPLHIFECPNSWRAFSSFEQRPWLQIYVPIYIRNEFLGLQWKMPETIFSIFLVKNDVDIWFCWIWACDKFQIIEKSFFWSKEYFEKNKNWLKYLIICANFISKWD